MPGKYDISGNFFQFLNVARILINTRVLNHLNLLFCKIKGVQIGKRITFNGYPIINRAPHSSIIIGDECRFNSSRRSIAVILTKRCRFVTTREGAVIRIGKNSGATGATIAAASGITIGDNVLIGAYSTIIDNDFHNADPRRREIYDFQGKPVTIEDNVFIGMNCLILKGVTIGRNSVIGANSVVVSDIPPDTIALGNPCRIVIKKSWDANKATQAS